jgi:hypothetical protein
MYSSFTPEISKTNIAEEISKSEWKTKVGTNGTPGFEII